MFSLMSDYEKKVKRGIRNSLNVTNPGMGISSNALKLITGCLSTLDSQLVDESVKYFARRKNPSTMPVSEARKAAVKILPRELLPLAEAAANKSIMRYNAGLLDYKPPLKKVRKTRRVLKTASKLIIPEFTKCVPVITHMVHDDISVDSEAKNMVGALMHKVVIALMEKALQVSAADRITSADIIKAVDNCMHDNMAKHAISEGVRTCLLFTSNLHRYKIDDFEKLRKNNTRNRVSRNK